MEKIIINIKLVTIETIANLEIFSIILKYNNQTDWYAVTMRKMFFTLFVLQRISEVL